MAMAPAAGPATLVSPNFGGGPTVYGPTTNSDPFGGLGGLATIGQTGATASAPAPINSAGSKRLYNRGSPNSWVNGATAQQINRHVHTYGDTYDKNANATFNPYPYSWTY
eukprot:TRINITY_DN27375_c0_g1_i1.p1 TRINITY_DN27375_c0_g1~~TRINITY_DN27375_c0_g1_i1.p1  ORF type:complete len:125 (-),score=4.24 TRINITY_DN27375_c0_g1_i1:55-384(-)